MTFGPRDQLSLIAVCFVWLLQYSFGPWPISADEVFAKTQLSYAFVNLKPIVPGKQLLAMLTCCCWAQPREGGAAASGSLLTTQGLLIFTIIT
jgi:hypothetical protein